MGLTRCRTGREDREKKGSIGYREKKVQREEREHGVGSPQTQCGFILASRAFGALLQ